MRPATSEENMRPPRYGLVALVFANLLFAFGPVLVRFSDTAPIASAFWRMAIALPLIALLAKATTRGGLRVSRGMAVVNAASGLLFAADVASWHLGIVRTKAANATLLAIPLA